MLKRLKEWIRWKVLELWREGKNANLENEELEMVKTFMYLGYIIKSSNIEVAGKRFRNGWNLKMTIFDVIVKGLLYGVKYKDETYEECLEEKIGRYNYRNTIAVLYNYRVDHDSERTGISRKYYVISTQLRKEY